MFVAIGLLSLKSLIHQTFHVTIYGIVDCWVSDLWCRIQFDAECWLFLCIIYVFFFSSCLHDCFWCPDFVFATAARNTNTNYQYNLNFLRKKKKKHHPKDSGAKPEIEKSHRERMPFKQFSICLYCCIWTLCATRWCFDVDFETG